MDWRSALGSWLLSQWEMLPLETLGQRLASSGTESLIDLFMSRRETEEIHALLDRPLSDSPRISTVLLPGLMGSLLASIRGISALLWINPVLLGEGQLNLLDLNDDGTADRSPDVEIVPVGIEKLIYLPLILALARETRLYEFPYDWRKRIEHNARALHEAIQRWAGDRAERRFVLIGHSMGGMVARAYLAMFPAEAERHIARVIMLGSPLYGAANAALIFTNETIPSQIVARLHADNDVVRLAANLPSSYQLLPPPPELFAPQRPYPFDWDLYDAQAWVSPAVRQDYLDEARRYHQRLAAADPQVELVEIAGCHRRTTTDVWRTGEDERGADASPYTIICGEQGPDSGDDTVPLWSVQRPGVETYYIEEGHNFLPGNRAVIEATLALVAGQTPALPRELPPPLGSQRLGPGTLLQQVAEMRERMQNGRLRRIDLDRLFFSR